MIKPPCLCTGRTDVRCNEDGCDLAVPPQFGHHQGCVVCFQYHFSAAHRKLWGGVGPAKTPPTDMTIPNLPPPPTLAKPTQTILTSSAASPLPSLLPSHGTIRLGDRIETALQLVGITKERVSTWLGSPCSCSERQNKLNQLSNAAEEALKSGVDKAKSLFKKMLGE